MMTAAPRRVVIAGTSAKKSHPTAADHMSSVYLNGASADASTREKDLRRKYRSKLAPAPRTARSPSCAPLTATQLRAAGTAAMSVVKSAV